MNVRPPSTRSSPSLSGEVLGLCLHLTGNRADAEDAAQEVFLVVFTKALPRFRGESRRLDLDLPDRDPGRIPRQGEASPRRTRWTSSRRSRRRDPALDRRARPAAPAGRSARLSFEHRTVLALFSLDGLTHREIAETLGIPEGTVWSRLHLARKKLAAELERLGFQRT